MSVISPLSREISAKIVYYGPGLSGKTTSLQHVHRTVKPERRGELVSLATETDRTIFFDFLPLHVERVRGMGVRLQLYTVPGQVFYAATRKLVLNGADGVVFVADSQVESRDGNLESLASLRENLKDLGLELENFPLVLQYNKRDLDNVMDKDTMSVDLNPEGVPEFLSSATTGEGVLPALKEISRLVIRSLWRQHPEDSTDKRRAPTIPYSDESIAGQLISVTRSSTAPIAKPQRTPSPASQPVPMKSEQPRANGVLSFAGLWPEPERAPVHAVERCLFNGDFAGAALSANRTLALLLGTLPGPEGDVGPSAKAALLGLDGREYLHLCRLATKPRESITEADALFALYMVIATQIKLRATAA